MMNLSLLAGFLGFLGLAVAFSSPSSPSASFSLFDRFKPTCPADIECIKNFDPSLVLSTHDETSIWVAVYRANNNKPSVLVKDEFLDAMRIATSVANEGSLSSNAGAPEQIETNFVEVEKKETPVAIARLRESSDFEGKFVLDSMRCSLNKENTDKSCDGGSEHTEALSVAIDALLLHHLNTADRFEGVIRSKATIVSGILLETRGFREVQSLSKDMATHISSLDACMEKYADRIVTTEAKNPGARDRALQIVNCLGGLDRIAELKALKQEDDDNNDYDPFAGMKLL